MKLSELQKNHSRYYSVVTFMERFCYIKDKKTNICRPIKLSNLQKKFINHLLNKNTYGKFSN